MKRTLRRRFWMEVALVVASAFLAFLTVVWNDWIEIVFRLNPDNHSGALERLIVVTCIAATIACIALARREWQRPHVATEVA